MAIVCTLLAIGLGIGAWRAKDEGGGIRAFWFACALLNAAAAAHMMTNGFSHTWRLLPYESVSDPGYHSRR